MRALLCIALTLLPAVEPPQLRAQSPARPGSTALEWMTLKSVEWPAISPDGGSVVYRIQVPDFGRNATTANLHVVETATGAQRQLTSGNGVSWAAAWSPDGGTIAYLSSDGKGTQVYLQAALGGTPLQLTSAPNGVDGFRWSPDGKRIAYVSGEPVPRPDSASVSESKAFRVLGREGWYSTSLWVVAVPAEGAQEAPAPERITLAADFAVDDAISWAPDGTRIAFTANDYKSAEAFWTYDLYTVRLADKAVRRVVADRGPQFFPLWSPDGRDIAFKTFVRTPRDDYHIYSIGYVATVPAEGGPTRVLTGDFDENLTPIAWGPDGIYFEARQRAYSHLFRVNPLTRAIQRVTEPAAALKTSFTFSRDFRRVAFVGQDSARYQEVYAATIDGTARPQRLTRMGDQLQGWAIGTRELVNWTSTDGTPIEGVLVKPADFDPRRKYPLLVVPHTGPLAADQLTITRDFPYPADLYAMRGILVLRPNYRGSIGYGARFRAALVRNQGLPQYQDLITGMDHFIAQGFVDSTRVGAAGWSAGAYIVGFGSVWEHRFRAVSMLEGVSDWRLFYTLGAGGGVRNDYSQATPWEDPEYHRMTSPLTYVTRARTPTLIQHGEADRTAPIASMYEMHRALLDHGVPVRMVVFPGMGHVPNSMLQSRAIVEQNLEWFEHWLIGRPRRQAQLESCRVPGLDSLKTVCATIPVPENRSVANGRMLGLRVVVVPPDSGPGLPDPIVPVPGGPGGGTIGAGGGWARILKPARAHRALILLDPRGAARSGALECDFSDGPERPGSAVGDFAPPDKVRECATRLSREADLTQYHTEAIADDLAEVLTALGYDRANLYGVSGGTRQAFVFAQRHPLRVRTLTLGGVVSPGFKLPLYYGQDFDRSLDLLWADCARDRDCHTAYPDPKGELHRVLTNLARAPALVPVPKPRGGADTARVTRDRFAERIRSMLYAGTLAVQVPFVVRRAAEGDFRPFVDPIVSAGPDGIAMGHYLSVTCSEDVSRITDVERAAAARGTRLGDYRVQQQVDACKLWPFARLPEAHFTFRVLETPALLISGDADPVTPPRWAEAIRKYLPASRHVVFPTGWHVPFGTPCAARLANEFILAGDARGVDGSCAATLTRPPFKLP